MIRLPRPPVLGLGLLMASTALAGPPVIGGIQPTGVRRGHSSEVAVAGSALAGRPRLVAPFDFKVGPPKTPGTDAAKWAFSLEVAPETAVGVYLVRVQTDDGLSNPFLFSVGQVGQVAEAEDNSRFEVAQGVPSPCVVEGQAAGADVDYFKFPGKKGRTIVVDAQCARIGSGVDPTIRLTTAGRKFVASADDTPGLLTDARMVVVLPDDGDYVIELSDSRYQGGARPVYRLLIGELPVATEVYPLGGRRGETVGFELRGGSVGDLRLGVARLDSTHQFELFHPRFPAAMIGLPDRNFEVESLPSLAVDDLPEYREPSDPGAPPLRVAPPCVLNGRIESKGDEDTFLLAVTPGQRLRMDVSAADLGSALDGVLQIKGAGGAVLASADDTTAPASGKMKGKKAPAVISPDPAIDFTVPSGLTEVSVSIKDLKGDGGLGFGYRLTVAPIVASFDLSLNDAQVSIPKGGSAAISVAVTRKGYTGPIVLDVLNPPPGLTVQPGVVGEGQAAGMFTVSAKADASIDRVDLAVIGRAEGANAPASVPASKLLTFAQLGTLPINVVTQIGLPAAIALAPAVTFETPAAPVEIVHGYGVPVPIKAVRAKGADGALALAPLPAPAVLPAGFAVPAATIAEKAVEGPAVVNAAVEAPLGPTTIVLTAKGKLVGKDETLVIPALTVNVVRPATVELASPPAGVDVKPGETVEVKGKVVRRGPFKEPVTVKLEGLPAGLKADPATVTLPPDKSEFTFKVIADAKAAPASAGAKVALTFQVNKKDYATPATPLPVKVVAAK